MTAAIARIHPVVTRARVVRWFALFLGGTTLAVSAVACGGSASDGVGQAGSAESAVAQQGLELAVVHDGLVGPTQFVIMDDGALLVATINGGENDEQGQVLRIDPSGDVEELVGELDKPTGIAVAHDELWIMERNRLTRRDLVAGPLADGPIAADPVVVADDLPNNGRSEGTLTVTPDGLILFDTSGSKRGADVVEGSGRLFTVDPNGRPGTPTELASGFKHAYAHAFDGDGVLWSVEMSDGRFDGEPATDELVAVVPGADHGWPWCVGDNRPVAEFGGTVDECALVPPSVAVFGPGATPTSVAISPFAANTLLVALWNDGRVVAVDTEPDDPSADPGALRDVVTGLSGPQHLVVHDGSVYLSEFGPGRILRIDSRS